MESKNLETSLVLIRLVRTVGYNIFINNKLIWTEVLEVAFTNRFARSIFCL